FKYHDFGMGEGFRLHVGPAVLNDEDFFLHNHEFDELVIVRGGRGVHRTEQGDYPIAEGEVFVLHGHQVHGFHDADELEIVNIMYDPREFLEPARDLPLLSGYHALFVLDPAQRHQGAFSQRFQLSPRQLAQANLRVEKIHGEFDVQMPGYQTLVAGEFRALVVELCRAFTGYSSQALPHRKLAESVAHMELHFRDPLRLDELAERAAMSPNHFLRVFRKLYHATPANYLIRLRVQHARDLLRDPDISVTRVALESGFSDGNYFSRQFRKVVGQSPRQYRKALASGYG
ncbi:MAG: AraC family transcriptional regulator, partial [Halioglobus sp.]